MTRRRRRRSRSSASPIIDAGNHRRWNHPRHCRLHVAGAGEGKSGDEDHRHLGVRVRPVRNAHRQGRHSRETVPTDTLALIVRGEPDFGLLPSTTPQPIRTLLRHCLDKEQRRRWPDAGSLRIAIEDARAAPADVATPVELTRPLNWRWMIVSAFVVVAAAALSALGAWRLARQEPPRRRCARPRWPCRRRARSPARWTSQRTAFSFGHRVVTRRPVARVHRRTARRAPTRCVASPAATACSAARTRARQLYVRRMDRLQATPIEGTEWAESPFFSPDGQWVGFWQAATLPAHPPSAS